MFELLFTDSARQTYEDLKKAASKSTSKAKTKSSKQEGLFKQLKKTCQLLQQNPRHPGLQTHEYTGIDHPWKKCEKVLEAYVQNHTASAYRLFWCYGPKRAQITVIAITQHP